MPKRELTKPQGRPRKERAVPPDVRAAVKAGIAATKQRNREALIPPPAPAEVVTARAQEAAKAMAVLTSRPELRFLEVAEKLNYLCAVVSGQVREQRAVGVGGGAQVIEDVPADVITPLKLRAFELLARMQGQLAAAPSQTTNVLVAGGKAPQVVRKTILYLNSRGPAPTDVETTEQK